MGVNCYIRNERTCVTDESVYSLVVADYDVVGGRMLTAAADDEIDLDALSVAGCYRDNLWALFLTLILHKACSRCAGIGLTINHLRHPDNTRPRNDLLCVKLNSDYRPTRYSLTDCDDVHWTAGCWIYDIQCSEWA